MTALHVDGIQNAISRTLTAVLVLHPIGTFALNYHTITIELNICPSVVFSYIACCFCFLALVVSLYALFSKDDRPRITSTLTLAIGILAFVLSFVVFLIDVIGVSVVGTAVGAASVHMTQGNAVRSPVSIQCAVNLNHILLG